jgi:hypothetical protein
VAQDDDLEFLELSRAEQQQGHLQNALDCDAITDKNTTPPGNSKKRRYSTQIELKHPTRFSAESLDTRPHGSDHEPREIAGETQDRADSSANSGDRHARRILRS